MAITTRDVITQDFVRDTVEEIVEEELIYRQAFREIDASGIESNSYTFYIEKNDMGRPSIVGEGEEAPRHGAQSPDEFTVQFDKFMGELVMTMEAMKDGLMEMKAREVENLARAMAEKLNEEAYDAITTATGANSYNGTGGLDPGDGNDVLSFEDIIQGVKALRKGPTDTDDTFEPNLMIVDVDGYTDLLTDDNFNRATDAGDEVVRSGEIQGEVAGVPFVVDTTQEIGTNGHGAFLIDTDRFGYELTRTSMTTREYEEPERQAEVVQAFCRKAWTAIFENAVVEVDG